MLAYQCSWIEEEKQPAALLNDDGVTARYGGKWHPEQVRRVLGRKRCQEDFRRAKEGIPWDTRMTRPLRAAEFGLVCHVLTRRAMPLPLFQKDGNYVGPTRASPRSPSKLFLTPAIAP